MHHMRTFKPLKKGISHHDKNFSQNVNVAGQNKCRGIVSRKISLFVKMQRGRSPSFELFQLDMYGSEIIKGQLVSIFFVPGIFLRRRDKVNEVEISTCLSPIPVFSTRGHTEKEGNICQLETF